MFWFQFLLAFTRFNNNIEITVQVSLSIWNRERVEPNIYLYVHFEDVLLIGHYFLLI